ncbi:MAG: hypothetical protein ACREO3_12320 [Arenimonas sp.]
MSTRAALRTTLALMLALAGVAVAAPAVAPDATTLHVPEAERRAPDQTYLTFPEWFLVFSPDENAALLEANRSPSTFPYFGHIDQFWRAYGRVIDATRAYPFNSEYHTMIGIIGVSTTVEYSIKGAYETLVGRLTELASTPNTTPEDQLATLQARAYVDFVRVRPWYEFDFFTPLRTLWTDTPLVGPDLLRKWERRYLLTSEWLVKGVYGAVLERAARSTYALPAITSWTVLEGPIDAMPAVDVPEPSVRLGDRALVALPRYHGYTPAAIALARRGAGFVEIAGNTGVILVSVVVPVAQPVPDDVGVLIRQPILTRPGFERRVFEVPVDRLGPWLAAHDAGGDRIEHVFDY